MSYSTGMMNKRVTLLSRQPAADGEFGRGSSGQVYTVGDTVWAAIDFVRGLRALREGAMDAYDTLMVRMRWTPSVTRETLLWHDGRVYEIQSLNGERQSNQIQLNVQERPDLEKGVRLAVGLYSQDGLRLTGSGGTELFAFHDETN